MFCHTPQSCLVAWHYLRKEARRMLAPLSRWNCLSLRPLFQISSLQLALRGICTPSHAEVPSVALPCISRTCSRLQANYLHVFPLGASFCRHLQMRSLSCPFGTLRSGQASPLFPLGLLVLRFLLGWPLFWWFFLVWSSSLPLAPPAR